MNQDAAFNTLKRKKKYIDDDVYEVVEKKISEDLELEDIEFEKKVSILIDKGISVEMIKNIILTEYYNSSLLKTLVT